MNPSDREMLAKQVAEDVHAKLEASLFPEGGAKHFTSGLGLPNLSVNVASLVSAGIDIAVNLAGTSVTSLVVAERDQIRQFLSDRALQFVQGLIQDLQVPSPVPAPAPKPAPAPAPNPGRVPTPEKT